MVGVTAHMGIRCLAGVIAGLEIQMWLQMAAGMEGIGCDEIEAVRVV